MSLSESLVSPLAPPTSRAPSRLMGGADPRGRLKRMEAELRRLLRASWRLARRPSRIVIDSIAIPVRPETWAPKIVSQLYREVYELPERRAIARLIRPEDRVLEVGTAIGFVAMEILRQSPAATRHYEANPALAEDARATFAANGLAPDLRIAALVPDTHADPTVTLHLGAEFWSSSLTARAGAEHSVTVPAERIGTVLCEFRPSVIVMDVEGAECALLAAPALPGVRLIAVELHRRITGAAAQSRLLRHLFDLGFHVDFEASARENLVLFREDAA